MHRLLAGHECRTAKQCGWSAIKNGDLLRLAEGQFDLFITSDPNLRSQQNLAGRRIAVLELSTNKLRRIHPAASLIQSALAGIRTGELSRLDIP